MLSLIQNEILGMQWRNRLIGSLVEAIKLLWMFRVPWDCAYTAGTASDWITLFSFGFYSIMLTSTIIGLVVNVLFKTRTWCSFCPIGTMPR